MPLRSSRWPLAGTAAGLVAAFVVLAGSPALASQVRRHEWWLRSLHVTGAWRTSRGSGVTVALLSTGVDARQADLTGSVTTGPDYTHSGRAPGGPYWGIRGTALASLIVGHGHGPGRTEGIMGVAPAARLLSVRVTLESGDPLLADPAVADRLPAAIAHGIRYAVRHGARVIDLPLDPVTTPGAAGAGGSRGEREAVAYALAHGVVLVAPAGDGGAGADPVNYPAAYHGVISVGAFDANFIKAPFSSRQPYVTLTAAGQGVIAAVPPRGYASLDSTSAASAVVAGIAALIRARFPALTPAQVRRALTRSTVYRPPGGRGNGSGYGTVDAARALTAAASIAGPTPAPPPAAGPGRTTAASPVVLTTHAATAGLAGTLLTVAGVAVAVLAVLAISFLAASRLQRRRARAARLAGLRAAAEIPPLRSRPGHAAPPVAPATGLLPAPPPPGDVQPHPEDAVHRGRADDAAGAVPPPPGRPGTVVSGPGGPGTDGPGLAGSAGAGRGAHRMGVIRRPTVSGSPPWGPAPRPDGEPPWAREPERGPAGTGSLPRRRPRSEEKASVWDTMAAEAWPGGPRRDTLHRPARASGEVGSRPASASASAAAAAAAADSTGSAAGPGTPGGGPGWPAVPRQPGAGENSPGGGESRTWNPGASTETFPPVNPGAS